MKIYRNYFIARAIADR